MARAHKTFRARFALPAAEIVSAEKTEVTVSADGEGPMTEDQLATLVDGQINDSKNYESVDLSRLRERSLKYFEGSIDIPSAPGRSSVVSRDIADVHGMIMPGLMRVFLATDRIAIYEPVSREDEPFSRQATDYVNHVVMKECGGYVQFRSGMHDGLLMGNGPIKHWWDHTPQYSTEDFSGLSDDAFTLLVTDPDVDDVIEHTEYDDPSWTPPPPMPMMAGQPIGMVGQMPGQLDAMGEQPEPQAPKLHDCKIKRVTSRGRLRVMALAPEDLLLGRGTLSLDEENCRFAAHRWVKTRSALIKEGFDADAVNDLPAYSGANLDTSEQLARDKHRLYEGDNPPDKSTDLIEGFECYVQCDYDGDGVAEWRKVVLAGLSGARELLANEEWGDDLPFSDIVPDPVPHRWRGRSLFDSMEDIQNIKSVLFRQTLDNIYMNNTPRQIVLENGVVNPEVLQDYEIGSTIIERQQNAIRYDTTPFVADKTFPILEYLDQVVEKRTGISRTSMSLDMEALSEQTATAVRANQAAVHTKVEEYARNIAEYGGLKRIFSKVLKLIVKHQDRPRTIRLRGEWVDVDPRAWNAEMDVTINTGLGSGSREHDLTMLMGVAAKQEAVIMQLGPTNPVLGLDKLFDTYRLMVEAAGLKPAERFFPEVQPEAMQQLAQAAAQRVDPKVQAEQMRAQVEGQKMQLQAQLDKQAQDSKAQIEYLAAQHTQQMDLAKAQREAEVQQLQLERQAQIEERQAQADIAVQQTKLQSEQAMERMRFEAEARLKSMDFEFKRQLELQKAAFEREKWEFEKQIKALDAETRRIAASKKSTGGSAE